MTLPLKLDRPDSAIIRRKRLSAAIAVCLSCLVVCGQMLSGCATTNKPGPAPYPAMTADMIPQEIVNTETALSRLPGNDSGKNEKADLLLRLAMLYAHQENRNRDYARAFDYLEQYKKLDNTVNAEYALSLLTQLSECISAKDKACTRLVRQNAELEQQCQDLTQENLYHKQVIEKLKSLDIQLEKKRKPFD